MKQFTKGILVGTAATLGALIGGAVSFHKTVVKPIEDEEIKFDENHKAAIRKGRSTHSK